MTEYTIPEATDLTVLYLNQVLLQKAPGLAELSKCFRDINIDRVIQTFIDNTIVSPDKVEKPDQAMFLAGQLDMGMKIKKLLTNIHNISTAVDNGDLDIDNVVASGVISSGDLELVRKLKAVNEGV